VTLVYLAGGVPVSSVRLGVLGANPTGGE
jgi:hypothetical protein